MSFIINTNFNVNSPYPIDIRLIVDRVDGVTASLVSLDTGYNYTNMIVWVRDEKAFYYLIDTPDDPLAPGATISDWFLFSGGGGATGCAKSGYVPGTSFTGNPATASVVFGTPYQSASYSVVVTGEAYNVDDYVYSVTDKTASGFIIRIDQAGPIGATAMWITNCWDGSGLSSGGAAGAQGPTGPGGSSAIDFEEIAYGTGTGITSSSTFTFDVAKTNLIFGTNSIFAFTDNRLGRNNIALGGCCNKIYQDNSNIPSISNDNSGILGGQFNYIKRSDESFIIGGSGSTINVSDCSAVIVGQENIICLSQNSSIIGGIRNKNYCTRESGIFNGKQNTIIGGGIAGEDCQNSVILGGCKNYIHSSESSIITGGHCGSLTQSCRSIITAGLNNSLYKVTDSSILNGRLNCVKEQSFSVVIGGHANSIGSLQGDVKSLSTANSNAIIGGVMNHVFGKSWMTSIVGGLCNSMTASCESSILGGCKNTITSAIRGAIIGGSKNIVEYSLGSAIISGASNSITYISPHSPNRESVIIGGYLNRIENGSLGGSSFVNILGGCGNKVVESQGSTIHSSRGSCVVGSGSFSSITSNCSSYINNANVSSIIAGRFNCINGGQSLVIFGEKNRINGLAIGSGILGGCQNTMTQSCNSLILGGCDLQMDLVDNMVYVPSIRGFGSVQFDLATTSTDYTLTQNNFTLLAYPTTAGLTVSLPLATQSVHRLYVIKKDGSSTQSVVYISPNGADTIEGYSGSIELINPWDYNILQSDGVNLWIKLGGAVGLNL